MRYRRLLDRNYEKRKKNIYSVEKNSSISETERYLLSRCIISMENNGGEFIAWTILNTLILSINDFYWFIDLDTYLVLKHLLIIIRTKRKTEKYNFFQLYIIRYIMSAKQYRRSWSSLYRRRHININFYHQFWCGYILSKLYFRWLDI